MFWNLEVTVPSLNIESLLQGKQKIMIRMGTFGPYRLKNFSEWRWGRHFLQRPQHNAIVPMFLVVFIARAAFVCELLRFLAHFKPHLLMFPYVPLRIRPIAIEAEIWVCLSLSLSESLSLRVSLPPSLSSLVPSLSPILFIIQRRAVITRLHLGEARGRQRTLAEQSVHSLASFLHFSPLSVVGTKTRESAEHHHCIDCVGDNHVRFQGPR